MILGRCRLATLLLVGNLVGAAFGQTPDIRNNVFSTATAAVSMSGGVEVTPDGNRLPQPVQEQTPTATAGPGGFANTELLEDISFEFVGPAGNTLGIATAFGFASAGIAGATARVSGNVRDALNATAQSTGTTIDELTWRSPGRAQMRVVIPIKITGTSSVTLSESPARELPPNQFAGAGFQVYADIRRSDGGILGVTRFTKNSLPELTFEEGNPFIVADVPTGVPVTFLMQIVASARANFSNDCPSCTPGNGRTTNFSASANYSNTVVWGGVESVTDPLTGTPILDWSVTSRSGADYSKSFETVPEPTSSFIAACGLAVGLMRRGRWPGHGHAIALAMSSRQGILGGSHAQRYRVGMAP